MTQQEALNDLNDELRSLKNTKIVVDCSDWKVDASTLLWDPSLSYHEAFSTEIRSTQREIELKKREEKLKKNGK